LSCEASCPTKPWRSRMAKQGLLPRTAYPILLSNQSPLLIPCGGAGRRWSLCPPPVRNVQTAQMVILRPMDGHGHSLAVRRTFPRAAQGAPGAADMSGQFPIWPGIVYCPTATGVRSRAGGGAAADLFAGVAEAMRGDDDHHLRLRLSGADASKEIADQGYVAEKRELALGAHSELVYQPAGCDAV